MTNPRPAPPGLITYAPPCPLCDDETNPIDSRFYCERCHCSWAIDRPDAPGEWDELDAPQCPDTIQPRHSNETVRCLLDADHGGNWHRADGYSWTGATA
ncbi:hypothetical protein AB0L13_16725 [Saccharopolyspora shandongensis]|uniref:hypothetical protein n=1 Tax=Saccharopolyspora shandongensis TaxID=418495 RepID=UPI00343DC7F5